MMSKQLTQVQEEVSKINSRSVRLLQAALIISVILVTRPHPDSNCIILHKAALLVRVCDREREGRTSTVLQIGPNQAIFVEQSSVFDNTPLQQALLGSTLRSLELNCPRLQLSVADSRFTFKPSLDIINQECLAPHTLEFLFMINYVIKPNFASFPCGYAIPNIVILQTYPCALHPVVCLCHCQVPNSTKCGIKSGKEQFNNCTCLTPARLGVCFVH